MESIEQRYRRYLENPDQMEIEARGDVQIDLDDALPDILKQASLFLGWAQLAAIADSQAEAMKQHHLMIEAECREKAFTNLTKLGEKATEQRTKDTALRDPALQKHLALRRKAETFAGRLDAVVKALFQKKDMLVQVSVRQRAELGFYQADDTPVRRNQNRNYPQDIDTYRPRQELRDLPLDELKRRATRSEE